MKIHGLIFALACLASCATVALAVESPPIWLRTFGNTGASATKLQGPAGMTLNAQGRLLIADGAKRRVAEFTLAGGYVREYTTTFSGFSPRGVATAPDGSVFACSNSSPSLTRMYSPSVDLYTPPPGLVGAYGLTDDGAGFLYISQTSTNRIVKFDAGTGAGGNTWILPFGSAPAGLWVADGLVYVACSGDHYVRVYGPSGLVREWGGFGSGPGQFNSPFGITVDGDAVYVADTFNHRIQKFTRDGVFLTQWGSLGSTAGKFDSPDGVLVAPTGEIFVADFSNNRIQVFGQAPVPVSRPTWGAVKRRGERPAGAR